MWCSMRIKLCKQANVASLKTSLKSEGTGEEQEYQVRMLATEMNVFALQTNKRTSASSMYHTEISHTHILKQIFTIRIEKNKL